MENHSRNIYDIVRKNICISCGVCYSICPFKAIVWDRNNLQPKINIEKCIGCKMCVNVCPSIEILNNYNKIYSNLESYLLGPIKEVYLGWSKNKKLRYKASSGGFVTQFLLDLMELGEIDGAIVTIQNNLLPYLGSAIIARNKRNIIMAKGSKYTLSSPGLLIKDIMKTNEKFAFVGLPCQILGLKKIEKFYKTLKEKIVLYIGLFCGHVPYRELYELIIKKEFGNNYSIKDIKRIEYRGDGWPGYLKIILKDGSILKLPHDYWIKNYFSTMIFTPLRCTFCNDSTAELADISVGDPWINEIIGSEKLGKSLIVVRTKRGKYFISKILNIELEKMSKSCILKSQKTNITFKKIKSRYRTNLSVFHYKELEESLIEKIISSISAKIIFSRKMEKLIFKFPKIIIKIYSFLVFLTTLYSYKFWKKFKQ